MKWAGRWEEAPFTKLFGGVETVRREHEDL